MSKCKVCEVHFKKRAGNQIYCSKECSGKGLFMKREKVCPECKETFLTAKNKVDGRKFCSRDCMSKSYSAKISKQELERMYIDERMTAREIGNIYSVSKTTILRAMKRHGITRRTNVESMMPIGYKKPTKEELKCLYWDKWMSYEEIGNLLGVDFSNVPLWLNEYGIRTRTNAETRLGKNFKEPSKSFLEELYVKQKLTTSDIGSILGCSSNLVSRRLHEHGIEVRSNIFNGADFITCSNGLKVRSNYEKVFVEQMIKRNIKFEYEPRLPFDKRYSADFLVKDIYVEVWGVQNNKRYSERKVKKKKLYKKNKLKLFSVYPHDFTNIENKVDELKHLIS